MNICAVGVKRKEGKKKQSNYLYKNVTYNFKKHKDNLKSQTVSKGEKFL